MRTGAVKYLKDFGWDVIVVMPNYESKKNIIRDNIWQIPFNGKYIQKLATLFERIGIYEDYLDKWVDNAFSYLKNIVNQKDIVFATSGGELGTYKLGTLLKNKLSCKLVVNYRDPINYTLVHGLKVDNRFHVSREKLEEKYISKADLIITSSESNRESLIKKYSKLRERILNNYFGYIKEVSFNDSKLIKKTKTLNIAYSGSMLSNVQKPEILYKALEKIKDKKIKIYFIGDKNHNKVLKNINDDRVIFIDYLPHDEYLEFMSNNIDIGFVSLCKDYYGACVPSKVYEYINLELPMIAALPKGDAIDIINKNSFGIANHYLNICDIAEAIEKFTNDEYYNKIKKNMLHRKKEWSMKKQIEELNNSLKELI